MATLLIYFVPATIFAANHNPKTMADLISIGLETNLGLQVEQVSVDNSYQDISIEKSAFDSTLFAGADYQRSTVISGASIGDINSKTSSGQAGISKRFKTGLTSSLSLSTDWTSDNDTSMSHDPRYRSGLLLDLKQPLLRDLGTAVNTTNLKITRNQHQQTALTYLLKVQSLVLQLESAIRQLGAKAEVVRLRNTAMELAEELYLANKKKYTAGVIPVSEVQEAETALASRQLSLSLALQEKNILQQDLNRQLNHSLSEQFEPYLLVDYEYEISPIDLPKFDQLYAVAQSSRLELKISDYTVQTRSLQQQYMDNQLKPRLDLKLQAGINGLSGDERTTATADQYSGDWSDSFSSMSEADGYQWQAGLEFSFPLGNHAAKSRYRQAELQSKQAKYQQKDLLALIKTEILQQQTNILATTEQLHLAERFEALAEKSYQQEQRRLDEGLSDTFRITVFQQKMIAAKIDRINAITSYHLALAQMEYVTGNIFKRHNIILQNKAEELSLENI